MIFKKYFNKDAEKANVFAEEFNISPFVMEIILSRGINTREKISAYLKPEKFLDPFLLDGMREFCDRIEIASKLKDKIVIFGDYDVDGVCATAIMIQALAKKGIKADYYLPNRYIDGYGLTFDTIDKVIQKFNPNLIITVDCGISCFKEVEYAASKGVEIIITDHHELPEVLPNGIVLNAKKDNQSFKFKDLCGAGLAFKIAQALIGEKESEFLLPIASIATIADIVTLLDENRVIVTRGLKLFEKYLPIGLKALLKENKVSLSKPSSSAISFKISPKLNASGRMGDAGDSLKLILETDPVKVKYLIEKINKHNFNRQQLCNKIFDEALTAIEKLDLKNLRVITLASKKWDQGVLGIVCSRLVEKFHRPVFLFAQEGDLLKGSGRSIDDINIHSVLSSLSDILVTYGGHSMAAGVTIKREDYSQFIKRINSVMFEKVSEQAFVPIVYYDNEINLSQINQNLLDELKLLQPCGCGNPTPKFKITTQDILVTPMKRFPEHADIMIGDFPLVFFNFMPIAKMLRFARQKSFIFEFQENERKGIINNFDGGSFIIPDANNYVFPFEIEQLAYNKVATAKYSLYQPANLLEYVSSISSTVFGTAFVTFNAYDYVEFAKTYSNQGLYHYGICDSFCSGYNSLLLSPVGIDWSKNFSKIVFLSPIMEEGYISKINQTTDAQIFVPANKQEKLDKYCTLNLSRENFAKIYTVLSSKNGFVFADVFDLYEKLFAQRKYRFLDVLVALEVFKELGLIQLIFSPDLKLITVKNVKKNLTESNIYNKLTLIKSLGGVNNE